MVRVPTERGRRYVIVTNRPSRAYEVNTGQDSLDHPFGVIDFEVDDFGDGTVFPRAQLTIAEDGAAGVNGCGKPGRLLNVSRQEREQSRHPGVRGPSRCRVPADTWRKA